MVGQGKELDREIAIVGFLQRVADAARAFNRRRRVVAFAIEREGWRAYEAPVLGRVVIHDFSPPGLADDLARWQPLQRRKASSEVGGSEPRFGSRRIDGPFDLLSLFASSIVIVDSALQFAVALDDCV